jgi:glutamate racemase
LQGTFTATRSANDMKPDVNCAGLGGLSVVGPIRHLLPHESLVYVADSAHCPYGEKPAEFLRERAAAICEFLIGEGCKAIVVACNTATVATVGPLRKRYAVPVVGLEPAVKPAAIATRSGVIGVLATSHTLQSEQYGLLLERYARKLKVLGEPCPGWVDLVEQGQLDGPLTEALVERHVRPLLAGGADTLVLGCTHYPFLRPVIERLAGAAVTILDTGEPVARQLRRRLAETGRLADTSSGTRHRFLTSGEPGTAEAFVRRAWPDIDVLETFAPQ